MSVLVKYQGSNFQKPKNIKDCNLVVAKESEISLLTLFHKEKTGAISGMYSTFLAAIKNIKNNYGGRCLI